MGGRDSQVMVFVSSLYSFQMSLRHIIVYPRTLLLVVINLQPDDLLSLLGTFFT